MKYTYKDVIIDSEDPRLKGAIGKEVYYSNIPAKCIKYANDIDIYPVYIGNLQKIEKYNEYPFIVDGTAKACIARACIIIKKEESKLKYKPYEFTKDNIREYWEKLKGRDFLRDETNIETVTIISEESYINAYMTDDLVDYAVWLDTGEPVGEKVEEGE